MPRVSSSKETFRNPESQPKAFESAKLVPWQRGHNLQIAASIGFPSNVFRFPPHKNSGCFDSWICCQKS